MKKENRFNLYSEELTRDETNQLLGMQSVGMHIDVTKFKRHPEYFRINKKNIFNVYEYIKSDHRNEEPVSINERSFQLTGDEKLLENKSSNQAKLKNLAQGKTFLNLCGITLNQLNIQETYEPLCYCRLNNHEAAKNVLIIENKDTFCTLRNYCKNHELFGVRFDVIVYGRGNDVSSPFNDVIQHPEFYPFDEKTEFYYFGDLDFEGLRIFYTLYDSMKDMFHIQLFEPCYVHILNEAFSKFEIEGLPTMKRNQSKPSKDNMIKFLKSFDSEVGNLISLIFLNNKYIPQEALMASDLEKGE